MIFFFFLKLEEQAIKNFRRKAIGMDEDIQDYVNMISKDFNEKFKKVKEKNKENWHVITHSIIIIYFSKIC